MHGLFESGPVSPLPSNPEGRVNGRVQSPPSPSSPGPTNERWPSSSSKPLFPSSYSASTSKTNGNGNAIPNGKPSSVSTSLPPSKSSALPPPPSSARLPNSSRAPAVARAPVPKLSTKLPLRAEQEKEQMLNTTGDICGGRGGELGRRLEAWIEVSGSKDRVEK
ncbi:hypothetical protein NLJ89_g9912 [Agrocybe chaxingu]|uniref:Uncharacterized protein n=1 Tax=Agrocybe chaxingu TaxID=84603 RepID=A0A9W8JSP8_9AGAR|nr:hypothetical protein NLJ89_g9912 [Agrocybe chaxingu]